MVYSYIYYITPGGAFFSFPVYIDIILYIPALILFYNFPRFIMYYYTISPRWLAFSLLPGVFAVDALEVLCLGSLAGPVCGSFLALSPLAVRGSALVALTGADCWSRGRVSSTCTKIHHSEKKIDPLYASIWGVLFILGLFPALRVFVRSVP